MINVNKIEALREQHCYSQATVAKMMGYKDRNTYNNKVKGIRQFTIEDLENLCKIYQVTPNDLIIL